VLFFALLVKPVIFIVLGLNLRHRERLPLKGPAVVAANHNSHLDGIVLMGLYPLRILHRLRPVAAADYFLSNKWLAWFTLNVIGIVPLDRTGATSRDHIFDGCKEVLDNNEILILFPEGTRGEPEELSQFKSGVAHVARACPDVPVVPIYMHGLGKALPRGEALLVPCICDVNVGPTIAWDGNKARFMETVQHRFDELAREIQREPDNDAEDGKA
jgi:1-acyl-sn-glycerol-3-phosphate acyltransferase